MYVLPLHPPAHRPRRHRPEQVGPKAANLAALTQAGLPTPGGFCAHGGGLSSSTAPARRRRSGRAIQRRRPADLAQAVGADPARRSISSRSRRRFSNRCSRPGARSARTRSLGAVRSSALIEDRKGANFAGQFESFLGLSDETEFLTAVRACWAALWTSHARRYMENHELSPADTAMGVLIQPLISARASGGGLSETAEGQMLISATWGLGSAIAQGEVVPDRIVLAKNGFLRTVEAGRKSHRDTCEHGEAGAATGAGRSGERAVPDAGRGGDARAAAAQVRAACRLAGRDRMGDGRGWLQAAAVAAAACRAGDRCPTRSGCSIPASTAIPPASAGARAARWW